VHTPFSRGCNLKINISLPSIKLRVLFIVPSSPSSLLDTNDKDSSDKKLTTQILSVSNPENMVPLGSGIFTDPHSLKAHPPSDISAC
jgi:hypothetical protein